MTRKQFQMIADVVNQIDDKSIRHDTAHKFVIELRKTNAQFQASRFLAACNVEHI